MDDQNWLEKIRGYIDLGMLDDASREIDRLPPRQSGTPDVEELQIIIMLDREEYESALSLSENLCTLFPEHPAGFVQGAYCLHAQGKTQEAIDHLQSGPETLREEPVYFYNLACYEVALGRTQAAQTWLKESFSMDNANRKKAIEDPDLVSLRDWILDETSS